MPARKTFKGSAEQQCKAATSGGRQCRAYAPAGHDYCGIHRITHGQTQGYALNEGPPPPGREGGRPPVDAAASTIDPPRVGADRLLKGQQDRRQERATYTAPVETGEYRIEPEIIGARVALLMHAAEMKSREEFRSRGAPRRDKDGMRLDDGDPEAARRPMRVLTRRQRPDPTRIIDPVTKLPPASLRPDFVQRWVATVDWNDRPTEHKVAEWEDYGAEFVTDDKGRPIESRYGVAMQLPPEQYAARMLDRTPTGAFQRDDHLQHADAIADMINRKTGHDDAVRIVAERDHGRRYSEVPLGQEHLHDV